MKVDSQEIPALFRPAVAPGWLPFDAPSLVGKSLRFVSGDPDGERFRLRYFQDEKKDLLALAWFGPETEGPPGHAHGGSMAAVLDEVLGLAAWTAGHPIVVGNLNVNFRRLLPLQLVTRVETEIVSVKGRKVLVRGRLTDGKDTLYAEADCLCIKIFEAPPLNGEPDPGEK
jgi:acyl-coenzyme A thioesterase PaaI-like protein